MSAPTAWKCGSEHFLRFYKKSRFGFLKFTESRVCVSCYIHSNTRNDNDGSSIVSKMRTIIGAGDSTSTGGGTPLLNDARHAMKEFLQPKATLNNLLIHGASEGNSVFQYQTSGKQMKQSVLTIKWPVEFEVVGKARKRVEAERMAAALACAKLKKLGFLDKHNRPRIPGKSFLYEKEDVKEFFKKDLQPSWISLEHGLKNNILEELSNLENLNNNIQPQASVGRGFCDAFSEELQLPVLDAITGRPVIQQTVQDRNLKNKILLDEQYVLEHCESSSRREAASLPISSMRQEIISIIQDNQVVVLSGETGCGKTTQVPQFLLEDFIKSDRGSQCNIIVTQPRRISAITVAQRVANEREESVGKSVGYQVRLNSTVPATGGCILFCTTGILLKKLQTNSSLTDISHVIIDEVHERDVDTDFLLILIKNMIKHNPKIRIILMSASINANMFSNYFQKCPMISVPGYTYPVKEFFLPEVQQMIGGKSFMSRGTQDENDRLRYPQTDVDLVVDLINQLDKSKPPGAILCFLPGWQDIKTIYDRLTDGIHKNKTNRLVLPVHSNFSISEQQKIFKKPDEGVRKIVLATNIAETSITINDVIYVINAGNHKENRYNSDIGVSCLDLQWISQANVRQRKGRAGRCQPGECFHLFTKEEYQQLDKYQVPELLRVPLEQVIVHAKVHNPDVASEEFLSQALEAPTNEAVDKAIEVLSEMGILDASEHLTPLGTKVAQLSTDPRLAKALVYSSIFRCVNPIMTIVAGLTSREPMREHLNNRPKLMEIKKRYGAESRSDHISRLNIYNAWEESLSEGFANSFVHKNSLDRGALYFIRGLRGQFNDNLKDAGLRSRKANQHAKHEELIKAVLCGAFVPNILQIRRGLRVKGRLKPNKLSFKDWHVGKVLLRGRSVNAKEKSYNSRWLTYFAKTQSVATFIHETSMVHPLGLICIAAKSASIEKLSNAYEEKLRKTLNCGDDSERIVRLSAAITDDNDKMLSFFMFEDVAEILLEVMEHVQCLVKESLEMNLSQLSTEMQSRHESIIDVVSKLLLTSQQPYIRQKTSGSYVKEESESDDSNYDGLTYSGEMTW